MEMTIVQKIAIWAIPLIFAITLHEVAHGWVASWCGDQTARLSGRLSLNPIHHIDLVGTIVVPLLMLVTTNFIFGWAKPVPVDGRNLRHPRRDAAFVSLAGPVANLLMAIFWGGVTAVALHLSQASYEWFAVPLYSMGIAGMMINIVLAVLNLLPLPPLDGGHLMMSLLPRHLAYKFGLIEPYGSVILIALLVTGILSAVMSPVVYFMLNLISGLYGL